jgi:hypothetical protein
MMLLRAAITLSSGNKIAVPSFDMAIPSSNFLSRSSDVATPNSNVLSPSFDVAIRRSNLEHRAPVFVMPSRVLWSVVALNSSACRLRSDIARLSPLPTAAVGSDQPPRSLTILSDHLITHK